MASNRAIFTDFSDELARQATVTVETGTSESGYGPELLVDDNPAKVFRSPNTSVALQFSFAAKTPLAFMSLHHGTFEADDDVRLQADDDADWDDPAFDVAFPMAGWVGAGASRWPVNPWLDLEAQEGFDPAGYKHYRLACGLSTPLSQALQLGQVRMHPSVRRMDFDRGVRLRPSKRIIEHVTAFGVSTIYTRGTTQWAASFGLGGLEDVDRASVEEHWDDVDGRSQPWVLVPDGTVNRCYLVRYATAELEMELALRGLAAASVSVQEVARGLRPGV